MAETDVHLFGVSGSGTSTFGRFISRKCEWFFMDSDDYFWEQTDPPYTTKRDVSDRIKLMIRDINQHGHVVLSGTLSGWGDVLIPGSPWQCVWTR